MNSRTSSAQPHPFAAGSVRSSHAPPSLRSAVAAWGGDTDTDLDPHSDAPLDPSQALRRAVRAICSDGHYLIEQVHKAEDTAQTPAILRGVFVIDPATRRPQLKRASALPLLALHPEHAGSLTALQENADPGRQFVCWVSVEGYRLPRQVHTCAIVDAVDGATVWEGPVHAPKSAASKRDTASRTSRSPALASDRLPSRGPSASVRQPSADDERFAAPLPSSSLDTTLHSPPALPPRPPQGASELSYMTSPDAARPRRFGPTTPLTRRDFSPEVNGHIDPAVAVSSGLLDLASRKARGESASRQSLSSQPLSNAEQQQNQRATSAVGQTPQDKGLMRAYHPDRVSVSPSNVVSPPAALFQLGSPDATIGRDAPVSAATVNDMGGATKLDELLQVAAVCSQATAKIMSAVDDAHGRLDKLYDITVPLTAGPPAERQAKDVALKMDELSSRLALMEEYVRAIELRQADVLATASAASAALVTQSTQVDITPEPVLAPQPPSVTQATQTEPEVPTVPQAPRPISAPMSGSVGTSRDANAVFDSASVAEPSVLDAPPAAAPAQAPREAPAAVEKPQAPASMKAVHEASAPAMSTTVASARDPSNEAKAPRPFEADVAQELAMMLVEAATAPVEPTAPSSEPQASQAAAVQQALTSVLLEAQAEALPRDVAPTIPPAVSLSAPTAPTAPVHQVAAPAEEETLASQILGHVTSTVPSDRGVSAIPSEAEAPMQGQAAEPQAEPEVVPQPYERPTQPPALPLPPYGQTLRYEAPGTPTEQP